MIITASRARHIKGLDIADVGIAVYVYVDMSLAGADIFETVPMTMVPGERCSNRQ